MIQPDAEGPPAAGSEQLESLLFQCLYAPEAERQAALAAACKRHPALAEDLRRCWQRIGQMQPEVGMPTRIAGHRIVRRLGGGGMGVVWLAEQEGLGRKVAIKLIRSDLIESAATRERFHREALAASRVEHPGLCPVFEIGEEDGMPYMVMPFLEGETMAARITWLAANESQRTTTLSPARAGLVSALASVARAAHHAHEHGLVHRDIKPGNIMLLHDGRPVLLDFGLARDANLDEPTLTRTGEHVGTPAYMAPEQLHGDSPAVDCRTDVYALGIVLHEVALLERPFASTDLLAMREQVQAGIRPGHLRGRLPYDLSSVILKATDPDPQRRYASAAAFADDLERFARMEPVTARRISAAERSVRWVRRHPVVSALLFLLALALAFAGSALHSALHEQQRFQGLALQGQSRAAERTDTARAVATALEADTIDPTPASLVQLNRALREHRESNHFQVDGKVQWLGFGPGHRHLHVVTVTGGMYSFEIQSLREVEHVPGTAGMRVDGVALAADGSYLVAGAWGHQALLWRFGTGEVRSIARKHVGNVWDVAISADSRTILTIGNDGKVGRWTAAGEPDGPFPWFTTQPGAGPRAIAWCGDATVLRGLGELVITRPTVAQPIRVPLWGNPTELACAPAQERILVRGLGRNALFDLNGRSVPLPGGQFSSSDVDISPAGDRVAIGIGNTLRVYDLRRAGVGVQGIAEASYRNVELGNGPFHPVRFSRDGQRLFAFGDDFTLSVCSADGNCLLQLRGFTKDVTALDFDADRQLLASGDATGTVRLWDVGMRPDTPPLFQVPDRRLYGLAVGGTNSLVAHCGDGRIAVLPLDGGDVRWIHGPDAFVDDARLGGQRLITGSRDGRARVWDLTTETLEWATPQPKEGARETSVVGIDFLAPDHLLVVLGRSSIQQAEFQIWRIGQTRNDPVARWVKKGLQRLNHGAATPDGRHVIVGSFSGAVLIVPVERNGAAFTFGSEIEIPHNDPVLHVDVAPAGDRFVVACADNMARVYDLSGQIVARCRGHEKRVEKARFSPRGDRIVTASMDGTARVFDAATGEEQMVIVVGAPSPVRDAHFSPDESVIHTLSSDAVITWWWLDRERLRAAARPR